MDYDLVAVCILKKSWLLLRHPLLFDSVLKLYKQINPGVSVCDIEKNITMSEYISIKETFGTHTVELEVELLRERCRLILQFVRTFKKKIDMVFKLNDSVRMNEDCTHVILFANFGISFVCDQGLHICQFYGDFQYVDRIEKSKKSLAEEFFDGKKWNDKNLLSQKVHAFKILFSP